MFTTAYSLLERVQHSSKDVEAWNRFVALYTPLLYRWARSFGLQCEDAYDVVQDVFVVLLRALPSYRPTSNVRFRSWLWAVMRNRVRDLRARNVPLPVSPANLSQEAAQTNASREEIAEEVSLLTRRAAELLRKDFQPVTWNVFWQTAVEGRSGKEVADEMGMSVGAVYTARSRVQRRIREELADFLS